MKTGDPVELNGTCYQKVLYFRCDVPSKTGYTYFITMTNFNRGTANYETRATAAGR
jgi:hypothetical protein